MSARLGFLRNPRHASPPRMAATTAPSSHEERPPWHGATTTAALMSSEVLCSPDCQLQGGSSPTAAAPARPAIKAGLTSLPGVALVAEPGEVVFNQYEPGAVLHARVRLRNVSGVMQSLRMLPPASRYFMASLPRWA